MSSKIVIVDYGMGNLHSVNKAIAFVGGDPVISSDAAVIAQADKLILPGVGAFGDCMANLQRSGLVPILQKYLHSGRPFLGICLGMQLMCRHSEEGNADCLGIFDTDVKLFSPTRHEDKVPHMGWNTLTHVRSDLFKGFTKEEFVYFVHSFYVPLNEFTAAQTDYILPYSSALHKDNFYATQFHPEKSGAVGERILRNFLEL